MNKSYEKYLNEHHQAQEVQQFLEGYSRLEEQFEVKLSDIIEVEEEVQSLRKKIYMDTTLTPLDKRIFPEIIKSYYAYTTNEELSNPKRVTKGQSAHY